LVEAGQMSFGSEGKQNKAKVLVGVVTRIDLLDYITRSYMRGDKQSGSSGAASKDPRSKL